MIGKERRIVGYRERKAIISQNCDVMTGADRQGELQLIAQLSSRTYAILFSPRLLFFLIISLRTKKQSSSAPLNTMITADPAGGLWKSTNIHPYLIVSFRMYV